MRNKTPSINLLAGKKKNYFDKFIIWALTFGRMLVIVTEAIALAAFLYRFILDRELVDLHDDITSMQAIVKLSKPNEDKFRNLQERLSLIAKTSEEGSKSIKLTTELFSLAPTDISITNLVLSKDEVIIDANAGSVDSLATFIKGLKDYPAIKNISVTKVENKTSSAIITISLTASLKQEAKNQETTE